jgi:hypothetical protein
MIRGVNSSQSAFEESNSESEKERSQHWEWVVDQSTARNYN